VITELVYLQILIANAPKHGRLHLLTHSIHEPVGHLVSAYYTYMKKTDNKQKYVLRYCIKKVINFT